MNQYTLTPFVLAPEQYDANGNLVGRTTASAQLQYVYDYADRLVAVNDLSGGLPGRSPPTAYDALGQRIGKTIYPSGLPPVTTEFVYDWRDDDSDGDIIEERVNGTLRRTYATPHVFDQKGRVMFTDAGETYFFIADDLGNTLALTDANGAVIERYDYDDFGSPIFLSADGLPTGEMESGVGNPFLFHGMEWDVELSLYHGGNGDYVDPQTGSPHKRPGATRFSHICLKRGYVAFNDGNPWSDGKTKAQDHNSSRSNKSSIAAPGGGGGGGSKAQDHNSSRSNKSGIAYAGGGGGGGFLLKKEEGGRHTPFHNKYRPQFRKILDYGEAGDSVDLLLKTCGCSRCTKKSYVGHVTLIKQ